MPDELKPCPFCGGTETGRCVSMYDGTWYGTIACSGCGASLEVENLPTEDAAHAELLRRWNTRATETALNAQLAEANRKIDWLKTKCSGAKAEEMQILDAIDFAERHAPSYETQAHKAQAQLAEAVGLLREARQHLSTYDSRIDGCDDCGQQSWESVKHTESCIVTRYDAFLARGGGVRC
jgi:Lar family restriction alleviation protein